MSAPVPEPGPGTGRTRPDPPFGPMRAPQAAARGPLSTGRAGPDLVAPRAARDTTRRATRHEAGSAGSPVGANRWFPSTPVTRNARTPLRAVVRWWTEWDSAPPYGSCQTGSDLRKRISTQV